MDALHSLRHATMETKHSEALAGRLIPDGDGKYPFPVLEGGSFIGMICRAQRQVTRLIDKTLRVLQCLGLLKKGDDVKVLQKEFCQIPVLG